MTEQNLIILNIPVLFEVLNEIKDNLNFKIVKVDNKNDLQKINSEIIENSIILSTLKNEIKENRNQIILSELPINIKNLLETLNVKLLKLKYNNESEIVAKNFKINLNSREISINGKKVKLTEKEIAIILFLNSSIKECSVDDLKREVWRYKTDLDTHTVETHIYRLRKKIKENFKDSKLIISTKIGYKIG